MTDCYFSTIDRKTVLKMPLPPSSFPELEYESRNEEFETFSNGTFNILGDVGLCKFNLEGFMPQYQGKYSYERSKVKAFDIINLWKTAQKTKKPLRIVIERNAVHGNNKEVINMMVSIENLTYHDDESQDFQYNVEFKEYRDPRAKR